METELITDYTLDEASRKTQRPWDQESLWAGMRGACRATAGPLHRAELPSLEALHTPLLICVPKEGWGTTGDGRWAPAQPQRPLKRAGGRLESAHSPDAPPAQA